MDVARDPRRLAQHFGNDRPALQRLERARAFALHRIGAREQGLQRRVVCAGVERALYRRLSPDPVAERSEEHTSELQSLMRISYAVYRLKNKTIPNYTQLNYTIS